MKKLLIVLALCLAVPAFDRASTYNPGTSSSSGTVTSVSVTSANGFAGTVGNSTTAASVTLTTTLNTPAIAGNGTSMVAATTSGSGTTVVLTNSPTLITPALGTPASGTLDNCTTATQSAGDNSTKLASTAYADGLNLFGGAVSFLNANSAPKTIVHSADWLQMTTNSIVLTSGTWLIHAECLYGATGNVYTYMAFAICTANGGDTGSQPAVLSPNKGGMVDTSNSASANYGTYNSSGSACRSFTEFLTCAHAVSGPTTIYAVPKATTSSPSTSTVLTNIWAIKISSQTS